MPGRNPEDSLARVVPALRRAKKRSMLRRPVVAWRHRALTSSDTMLVSFPRSGSTWLRFMLAGAVSPEPVEFDSVDEMVPFVGAPRTRRTARWGTSGHLIKSHERYSRLYDSHYRRFVYLIRDGRDVALSYFYYCLRNGWWLGEFSPFLDAFLTGRLDGYGPWHRHVEGWLEMGARRAEHILVRYEDLHRDAGAELQRCAGFLHTPLSQENLQEGLAAGSADRMRSSEERSSTLRSHRVADPGIPVVRSTKPSNWRRELTEMDLAKFQRYAGRALELGGYEPA
jgi:hypothetical protein